MAEAWLLSYDVCAQLGQDIMESIRERNKQPKTSTTFAKKSATVRVQMTKYDRDLAKLREDLTKCAIQHKITQRECDRRSNMLDDLVTKQKQIDLAFKNEDQRSVTRSSLFSGSAFADDWGHSNTNAAGVSGYDNDLGLDQIRIQQRQMIEEQDQGLDALSRVVTRQKQIAIDIGNEVTDQNEILDDINDHMDHTNTRLLREKHHIKIVDRKSGTCWMWIVIVLLAVAIIVIAAVPFN
jgi:syntaxin 8